VEGVLECIQGGLIVSCQAGEGSPFRGSRFMAAMAVAAEQGGAVGIRANGPADVRAIRRATSLPIIGIYKRRELNPDVYITPDVASARAVIRAGADIVAVDGTARRARGLEASLWSSSCTALSALIMCGSWPISPPWRKH